jgi:uncharacterized membrane protein
MTTSPAAIDTVVHDYLWRVQAALSTVPAPGRQEIVSELAEHIREAREDGAVATEADARNLVDRLGDPVEIAAEAHRRFGTLVRPTAGVREVAAVIFLSLGLLLPFLGWFVGVVLLWTSDAWNRRDKIIGSVLTSGGSLGVFLLVLVASTGGHVYVNGQEIGGSQSWGVTDLVPALAAFAVFALPIATAVYLLVRLRRPAARRFLA